MSATIRAAKSDGSAVWTLLAISFAYGIFHAAGPGHGKAVISSYLVANEETARRGIVLSFVSALMQSLVAVLIVGIGAWLLNVTAKTMCGAERVIEIASYALIAAFGARLVWTKGGGFIRALQSSRQRRAGAGAGAWRAHGHDITTTIIMATIITTMPCATPMRHAAHASHDHDHDHDHVHDEHCGHSHGPEPGQLAGPGGWRRGLRRRLRRRHPAVFGRHPGAGVRAGAGPVLGRRRRDLRDGPRHRDHGRHHRRHRGLRQGPGARASAPAARAAARW